MALKDFFNKLKMNRSLVEGSQHDITGDGGSVNLAEVLKVCLDPLNARQMTDIEQCEVTVLSILDAV